MITPTASIDIGTDSILIRGTPEGIGALCEEIKKAAKQQADSTGCIGGITLKLNTGSLESVISRTFKTIHVHSHHKFTVQ
jgi:hypothetical protein